MHPCLIADSFYTLLIYIFSNNPKIELVSHLHSVMHFSRCLPKSEVMWAHSAFLCEWLCVNNSQPQSTSFYHFYSPLIVKYNFVLVLYETTVFPRMLNAGGISKLPAKCPLTSQS